MGKDAKAKAKTREPRFEQIRFDLIEEGALANSWDAALEEGFKKLLGHVAQYGAGNVGKAKASVTLAVTFQIESQNGDYSIKGAITSKVPGRPSIVTKAIHGVDDDGEETLLVRRSGSTGDEDPRQLKVFTDDARVIDPSNGKPKPKETASA